jgi:hypothetical protein
MNPNQYGIKTANKLEAPLKARSVVTQHLGDNGYTWTGVYTVRSLYFNDGNLVSTNNSSASATWGTPGITNTLGNDYIIDYDEGMITRIPRQAQQDVPIDSLGAQWAAQQLADVFIPAHDEYSLSKIEAAVPYANKIEITTTGSAVWPNANLPTTGLNLAFQQAVNLARVAGNPNQSSMIAWASYDFVASLRAQTNYTGSNLGFENAQGAMLGKYNGVTTVETPDIYFLAGTYVLIADKRAVINVTPKVSPEDFRILTQVPGFDGIEVQIRDRGATIPMLRRVQNLSLIYGSNS